MAGIKASKRMSQLSSAPISLNHSMKLGHKRPSTGSRVGSGSNTASRKSSQKRLLKPASVKNGNKSTVFAQNRLTPVEEMNDSMMLNRDCDID